MATTRKGKNSFLEDLCISPEATFQCLCSLVSGYAGCEFRETKCRPQPFASIQIELGRDPFGAVNSRTVLSAGICGFCAVVVGSQPDNCMDSPVFVCQPRIRTGWVWSVIRWGHCRIWTLYGGGLRDRPRMFAPMKKAMRPVHTRKILKNDMETKRLFRGSTIPSICQAMGDSRKSRVRLRSRRVL